MSLAAQVSFRRKVMFMYQLCNKKDANIKLSIGKTGWIEGLLLDNGTFGGGYEKRTNYRYKDLTEAEKARRKALNRERAARRAKTAIRHKAKGIAGEHGAVFMLTLTYAENMQDHSRMAADFRKFARTIKKRYPNFEYIAVAEKQKRGAYHYHMITNLWLKHSEWESTWGKGYCWVKQAQNSRQVIRYVTKYITKAFEDCEDGNHRYYTSHGLGERTCYVYATTNSRMRMSAVIELLRSMGSILVVGMEYAPYDHGFYWFEGEVISPV